MPTFDPLTRARHRARLHPLDRLQVNQRGTTSRPGTEFRTPDVEELVQRLDASDCFCRDSRVGRLYHRRVASFREISPRDSLHITLDEVGRVATHVDRHSPLARRQPGGTCRYSPWRIAAHNLSGVAADLVRLALGRPDRRTQELELEQTPVDHEDLTETVSAKSDPTRGVTPEPPFAPWAAYPGGMDRTYSVPDISCDHCKHAIETEVATVDGVERVDVDVAAKTVRVTGGAEDAAVRAAIDEAGYEVAATD